VKFFQILTLCHTVQVDDSLEERYQASSPDELSLLQFSSRLGVVYDGEEPDPHNNGCMLRLVAYNNQLFKYQLLNVFEFDSDRKRMSVIVRDLTTNKILLLCKGADSSMFKICNTGNVTACQADVKIYAHEGWRTLVVAYKHLSEQEYASVDVSIRRALNDIANRSEQLSSVYEEVEANLELVGVTAVEDKLQEDVADTLEKLRKAGIKIWVLTGDKTETAINISQACHHFSDSMVRLTLVELKDVEEIKKRLLLFQTQ
jgi:phospholipid-translocating ATPase